MKTYENSDLPSGIRIASQTENFVQLRADYPITIELCEDLLKRGLSVIGGGMAGYEIIIGCHKQVTP